MAIARLRTPLNPKSSPRAWPRVNSPAHSTYRRPQSTELAAVPAIADGAQAAASAAPPADAPRKTPRRTPLRGAQALPEHLERREVLVQPAAEECVCPGCGESRTPMGEEVSALA